MRAEITSVEHVNGVDPMQLEKDIVIFFSNGGSGAEEIEDALESLDINFKTYYSSNFEAILFYNGSYYATHDLTKLIDNLK